MFEHSADELYTVIASNSYDLNAKCQILTEFKGHIKRNFVELTDVYRYFETLKIANKSTDFKLSSIAFSSICHLIKRIGMQDPNVLNGASKIVLPLLFQRLLDPKPSFQSQAKHALETFWLATPSTVEIYLKDSALIHSNHRIRSETIVFISDLIELNKTFNFAAFLPNLINLLRDDSVEVVKNVEVLLLKYYTIHRSKITDLSRELKTQEIDPKKAAKILRDIDPVAANLYISELKDQQRQQTSTIDTIANLRNKNSNTNLRPQQPVTKFLTSSKELSEILNKIPSTKLDETIRPSALDSLSDLNRELDLLLPPFSGKETEFNWANREKNIIKFRGIVRGNSEIYPEALVTFTRSFSDGISKAVTSLRTTLSSNGCQLVKELAVYLAKHLDPIADVLFQQLASMTSATKKITSVNAFGSLCVLLTNTSFNSRIFSQCYHLFQDKNVQPRLYSSTFLQIFILKHGNKLDDNNIEIMIKWISKGLSDPNITVRESMRNTFWILYKRFQETADLIISKQDNNVKKALERSKPKDIAHINNAPVLSIANERKRPSVRDFVSRQREKRSTSDPSSMDLLNNENVSEPQDELQANGEMGKRTRIGMPQRVNRASSSGSNKPLQKIHSKGTFTHNEKGRSISLNQLKTERSLTNDIVIDTAVTEANPEEIVNMKMQLKSPFTRERIEGIQTLKKLLENDYLVPDLSSALINLMILDSNLLIPVFKFPKFFKMIPAESIIKLFALNNEEDVSPLIKVLGLAEVIQGLIKVIKTLESLQFEHAPSTMFHIKYKTRFLDFVVANLYFITSEKENDVSGFLSDICQAIFPLSINDYPKYDELIVDLQQLDPEIFSIVLSTSSPYIKSKVNSILEDFKDKSDEKPDFTEQGLGEMTMINPLNRKADDPTTTVRAGFGSDMTMIIPSFRKPAQIKIEDVRNASENVIDDGKNNYMSDIFIKQEEVNGDHEIQETNQGSDETNKHNITELNKEAVQIKREPEAQSPFLDDPAQDDIIDHKLDTPMTKKTEAQQHESSPKAEFLLQDKSDTDDATRDITNHIDRIRISPVKEENDSPRTSLAELIDYSDPIFKKMKKGFKIFEDAPPILNYERKLFGLEICKSCSEKNESSNDTNISSIEELIEQFKRDQVDITTMNRTIKTLHESTNDAPVLDWLKSTGYNSIIYAVIDYFNNSINVTQDLCFKGLIVLRELIILDNLLESVISESEVKALWDVCIMIIEYLKDSKNQIYVAIDELMDEILELNSINAKRMIREECCLLLNDPEATTLITSFSLLSVSKCIEDENLSFEEIKEVDRVIFKYLSNDEVEIRRLTIITYSKCKKKLLNSTFSQNSTNITGKSRFMAYKDGNDVDSIESIFDKLSVPQKKLVEYYCNN